MGDEWEHVYINYFCNVLLVGESGVGKTNMLSRFIKNEFNPEFKYTIVVEYSTHKIRFNDKVIMAYFWDMAGHPRYRTMTDACYRRVVGAIIVYDITRKATFENVESWLKEIRDHTKQNIVIMLVGNKADLSHLREVQTEEAKALAERENILFMETSALKSFNVENTFTKVLNEIYLVINNTVLNGKDSTAISGRQTIGVRGK